MTWLYSILSRVSVRLRADRSQCTDRTLLLELSGVFLIDGHENIGLACEY